MAVISELSNPLNILAMLKVKILGNSSEKAYVEAERLVSVLGCTIVEDSADADVAIAPLLHEKLTEEQIHEPVFGTLIFHPSPLPYGRGASAIKWAYKRREPITAATWFWADNGLDTGDVCEQEIVKIDYDLRPRDFYLQHVIPAMLRTLERSLKELSIGVKRRVPQVEQYASYDKKL